METGFKEAEWVRTLYDQLSFIEKNRMIALCHGQCYQRRIARAYDKEVKPKTLQEGVLVLKKILPFRKVSRGKFWPNYEAPYIVTKVLSVKLCIRVGGLGQGYCTA